MKNTSIFLTEVATDWPESNLAVMQDVLREAEEATLQRTNIVTDPLLDVPNLANLRGYTRWVLVQACLERAVKAGRLQGITSAWVSLGGVSVLELRGKYTTVTPYHLHYEDDTPRESNFRQSKRVENMLCPFLKGFEQDFGGDISNLIHLLLVHGGKDSDFAYLRAYYDAEHRSLYRQVSANILLMPTLLPELESEPVLEPQIGLKDERKTGQSSA